MGRSDRFEPLLADVSARLWSDDLCDLDTEVAHVLDGLIDVLGTDHAFLLELLPGGETIGITGSRARAGVRSAATRARTAHCPWYHDQLRAGSTLRLASLPDELPPGATPERAYARALPMRSHVAVPLTMRGRWAFALLTSMAFEAREWTDDEVGRVRIAGQMLASAIHRRRIETELRASLRTLRALQRRSEAENAYLRESTDLDAGFEQIAGTSPALRKVIEEAAEVAPTSTAVLVLGETGTGKELLARAIHARSRRAERPLVKVNCAALPASLVESELFGHEKGAFTGATAAKVGRFELANGGSIFLDEIGEMPLEAQAKLLRVLQDGEFERVGAVRSRKVDVRVIAATNRDLERAIADGHFREDLYYRLSVFPLRLPPLRERACDIPILVWDLIHRRQHELGRRITEVPEAMMAALMRHAWPGSVRELANVIERALILSRSSTLAYEALPTPRNGRADDPVRLVDVERAHFQRVLERCGWRINGAGNAAEQLGMQPSTLRSRLRKLGIARPAPERVGSPALLPPAPEGAASRT